MSEKRRHQRVAHRSVVRIDAAETTFEGISVDISRAGLLVEVPEPNRLDRVESVRFSFPEGQTEYVLPARVVRRSRCNETGGHRFAFEFLGSSDPQLRLLERFIHSIRTGRPHESRRIPRVDCRIPAHIPDDLQELVIENISTEGILLAGNGAFPGEKPFTLEFSLPDDDRTIRTVAQVAYVVTEPTGRVRAGASFVGLSGVHRARIVRFIENATASESFRTAHAAIGEGEAGAFRVTGEEVVRLFADAHSVTYYLLIEGNPRIFQGTLGFDDARSREDTLVFRVVEAIPVTTADTLFVSFSYDGSNHYFSSAPKWVRDSGEGVTAIGVTLPRKIHRSDNRSARRQTVTADAFISLRIDGAGDTDRVVEGEIIDIARRGFRCRLQIPRNTLPYLEAGRTVSYRTSAATGMPAFGRIRHFEVIDSGSPIATVEVGIEAGVRRGTMIVESIDPEEWASRLGTAPEIKPGGHVPDRSARVEFRNRRGEPIVGLVNRVEGPGDPVVVIIPPAFGKKKETLAPLAASICYNFSRAGQGAVVLRYDGVNRPGESHNEIADPVRGYEMLSYRPRQGVEDMRAALDFVYSNGTFHPSRVILVTASMSSVDARKLLLTEGSRVAAWVSLMGVPAARTTLMNVLAGTDIIANAQGGIRNGVRGMLGHFVDMDTLARDLIDEGYAFITDARFDLARVAVPVLWIVGAYDHWVDPSEVEDIMSVESGYHRRLIRIPAGHNLRTSDDAAEAFRIIASYSMETAELSGDACVPPREMVLRFIESEREAVFRPLAASEVATYWHEYLLGTGGTKEGYDFYGRLDEYREFVTWQVSLADPRPGYRIADMACGTGLVTREILRTLAGRSAAGAPRLRETQIDAVDLVPDALVRTREKCEAVIENHPHLRAIAVTYIEGDLEANENLPEPPAGGYDAIIASLFISYVLDPVRLLHRFHRMMREGGRIVVSSMRPDSDVSTIFTRYVEGLEATGGDDTALTSAREMLNEAASLFELEEDGHFRFFDDVELGKLLTSAGFRDVEVVPALGTPAQAFIATGYAVANPSAMGGSDG
ncbi:MAG: PilZ domain-containing protein [Alkalispirochaeta sp.]